ncbi:MAG: MotA/TolQ/ExbB proton channel family protein [Erythrobacter sp.]|uniref:MotA/TolQ/ExbB proton channel family protein n=1 Tax=Erythrobacter sp. TaxID=1042 RepID=UPI00261CB83F|nr:MotA/TolQ/ExbB proton channel family protein [Erythrobacter sp.]MDJ0979160.1 MotA/TolQ/ExbB proton channel family protein [Erythrobacter sp.]
MFVHAALTPPPAPPDTALLDAALVDPSALAIVLAGTFLATLARSGWRDVAAAIAGLRDLARAPFDADANRTALARWARAVRARGTLGADEPPPPDPDLAKALKALVRTGSVEALQAAHGTARSSATRKSQRAVQVFEQAGELAPVFGLVGTLFSLTQIAPDLVGEAGAGAFDAIAIAVLSSLYGVLSAHLVFLPLAHALARRAEREDTERAALVNWFLNDIAEVLPSVPPRRMTPLKTVA